VSGFNGVTCTNAAAAVGIDAQAPETTVAQCRDKLGSLSPNGPAAAYTYVAQNSALTGTPNITQARTYPDSATGDVMIYVRGASGVVGSPDVALVQAAINQWATPLCITPTVLSVSTVTINVTYSIWLYQSVNATSAAIEAEIQTVLENFFAARPIGGDIIPPATTGSLYASMVTAEIGSAYPDDTFRVLLTLPSSDTALTNGQVPILGTVTPTVTIVPVPT
jgi:Baseplate J-like protein